MADAEPAPFTRCVNEHTGGEADLATEALPMWRERGWSPVESAAAPTPKQRQTKRSEA